MATTTTDGLTFRAYPGDGAVLLAFDVDEKLKDDLAGFAVEYVDPDGTTIPVLNRLSFAQAITATTTPAQRKFTPTSEAPLQKFHWVHFPPDVKPGAFKYTATAMLFKQGSESEIEKGPTAEASVELMPAAPAKFTLGFTRGYISSQAYVDDFNNAPIEPSPPTFDFDTTGYQKQYHWLGFHARRLVFDFVTEAVADPTATLDVFAYDLDEPDVIRALESLGPRLRIYLDDSASHVKAKAREVPAKAALTASAGAGNVKTGHFHRFSHSKVMILKRGGQAVKVLSGSANFSVRGLYVQSNNVFVIDDPQTAGLYEQVFDQAWTDPGGFAKSEIASKWFACGGPGLPAFSVAFSPHAHAAVSLDRVTQAVLDAKSSVMFAIMEIGAGSGTLLDAVRALPQRQGLYAFGTTQRLDGALAVQSPGADSPFIPFSFLSKKVPDPFRPEWSGGSGQVIHHKFVVVDFNGETPLAFAGSSNLAGGGEEANGDNLVAIEDRDLVVKYAIEAIQLIDHYRFRAVMQGATQSKPLQLHTRSEKWAASSYDPASPKFVERTLFVS